MSRAQCLEAGGHRAGGGGGWQQQSHVLLCVASGARPPSPTSPRRHRRKRACAFDQPRSAGDVQRRGNVQRPRTRPPPDTSPGKFGILDAQNTWGSHTPPSFPFFACVILSPRSGGSGVRRFAEQTDPMPAGPRTAALTRATRAPPARPTGRPNTCHRRAPSARPGAAHSQELMARCDCTCCQV